MAGAHIIQLINKLVTWLYFILSITRSLAYVMCKHRINVYKKCRKIDDDFGGHADGAIQCDAHGPMECI